MRFLAILLVVLAAGVFIASQTVPTCRNYAGTARDSGYPCKIDRASGATDFVLSRDSTVSIPFTFGIFGGLVVVGGALLLRDRRRS